MRNSIRIQLLPPSYHELERLCQLLSEKFNVIQTSDNPDILIGNVFTPSKYLSRPGIKIFHGGENCSPDFNLYDYAFGHDDLTFGDRYIRLPLYCLYPEFDTLLEPAKDIDESALLDRQFCSMVVSNGFCAHPIRKEFFEELSKYKRVDSAGKYMNNMGGGYLQDKLSFISKYKFNIAFENSAVAGYTTEKIVQAMSANTCPIYWGNPTVSQDFNEKSFVNLQTFDSVKDCVEFIVELDKNDDLYLSMMRQNKLNPQNSLKDYKEDIWEFFGNILSKVHLSYVSEYGYQAIYRNSLIEKDERLEQYKAKKNEINPFLKGYNILKNRANWFSNLFKSTLL